MSGSHRLRGAVPAQVGQGSSRIFRSNLNPVFHRRTKGEDDGVISKQMLKIARGTGALNLSGRALATVPDKIYDINVSNNETEPATLEELCVKEDDAWWNLVPLANLDLSSNSLTTISSKIENLESLTTLMLHDNVLVTLPEEIGRLERLERLNLSRNKIKTLPGALFTLPNLRYLNLSHNELHELNPGVTDLHMLELLDVGHNNLQELPSGIGFLVRLTAFLAPYNHIKLLPPDLVNMRSLQKLELTHNDLTELPEDIGSLRKLQCLYAQHNDLKELPSFEGCFDLQELHVSNNFIEALPKSLCSNLPHLKILDLRDNKIVELPSEICLLVNLCRLDLSNNSVTNLPVTLATLPHLISLQVEGNPIKSIRRDIIQCGTVRILKTLHERALAEQRECAEQQAALTAGPKMVGDGLNSPRLQGGRTAQDSVFPDKYKLRQTRMLVVNKSDLTEVPDEVFEMAKSEYVTCVDLSNNRLETLPSGLQHLNGIVSELNFSKNLIKSVPPLISSSSRLSVLNLSGNLLRDLPAEFRELKSLRELNISNNRFEVLPTCVYELEGLETLIAKDNQINAIDATEYGLGALRRLAVLELGNNNISAVPPILGNLKNITFLNLVGNPFRQPRHQILMKGTEAVMSYLRDRIPQ